MQIIYQRSQSNSSFSLVPLRIAGGIAFSLWAKIELSQEEQFLFDRYRFRDALLVEGDAFVALKRAARISIVITLVLGGAIAVFVNWHVAAVMSGIGFVGLTLAFYDRLREHIYARDLIDGRTFRCFSVIELIEKEWYLERVCGYLRQVLESARHWEDRETINIKALSRDAAKHVVLKGI